MTDDATVDNIVKLAAYQDDGKKQLITEDAAALVFAARYCDHLRFDHDVGKWFAWTGSIGGSSAPDWRSHGRAISPAS